MAEYVSSAGATRLPVVDLHMHTTRSDGALEPEDLVRKAHAAGLEVIAITDHDTIDGLEAGAVTGRELGVRVVSGVELSIRFDGRELHLLGYFFDERHAGFLHFIRYHSAARERRAVRIIEKLAALGAHLDYEKLRADIGQAVIGRPHIAQALVDTGFVDTFELAFVQYLRNGGPADVEKELAPLSEALRVLHEAGGIGVLAHPGHWVTDRDIRRMVEFGLDGVEVIHPSHDEILSSFYENLADDLGLVKTGGSDFHGMRPGDEDHFGRTGLSFEQFEALTEAV